MTLRGISKEVTNVSRGLSYGMSVIHKLVFVTIRYSRYIFDIESEIPNKAV